MLRNAVSTTGFTSSIHPLAMLALV